MRYTLLGKTKNPVILILPGKNLSPDILIDAFSKLTGKYCLAVVTFDDGEDTPEYKLKEWTDSFFPAGLWGAYGLYDGGRLLLSACAEYNINVRTVIVEGTTDGPLLHEESSTPKRLELWFGVKDKAAKNFAKKMRESFSRSYTLSFKKRKSGEYFILIRPDLMIKRMKQSYGYPSNPWIEKVKHLFIQSK